MRCASCSTANAVIALVVGAPQSTCAQDAPAQVGVEGRWEARLGVSGLRLCSSSRRRAMVCSSVR
jgi:hypothetical protein